MAGPIGATVDSNVYIHTGCNNLAYPVYSKNKNCQNSFGSDCADAFGEGWYCNDGEDVSGYDTANFKSGFIHTSYDACDDGMCLSYSNGVNAWLCKDDNGFSLISMLNKDTDY